MSGYVDSFFTHFLDYLNLLLQAEIIKYLLSFYIVMMVLGVFKSLITSNRYRGERRPL